MRDMSDEELKLSFDTSVKIFRGDDVPEREEFLKTSIINATRLIAETYGDKSTALFMLGGYLEFIGDDFFDRICEDALTVAQAIADERSEGEDE